MKGLRALLPLLAPFLGLLAVWCFFALAAGGDFTSFSNLRLMLLQTAVVGTAAIGATLIIAGGGIDLSVGSSVALGTVIGALVLTQGGSPAAAALAMPLMGLYLGAWIGCLVSGRVLSALALAVALLAACWGLRTQAGALPIAIALFGGAAAAVFAARFPWRLPLSPFIVTLGTWGALRGLAKGLGDNQPVYPASTGWIAELMQGGSWLAPGVWLWLGLAVLAALYLSHTVPGRHLFAVGSNERTARLCGVDVERTQLLTYSLGIACAGVAALLQLSYLSMGDPTTAQGLELRAIAAAVIGGASLAGGSGSIPGTIAGALLMTVVDNGCTKLGMDNWVQEVVTGAIIVTAVALDRWRGRRTT